MLEKLVKSSNLFYAWVVLTGMALVVYVFTLRAFDQNLDRVKRIYFADNISPAHQAVIDSFNTLHAGRLQVVPIDLPFSKFSTYERKQLLTRALRTRNTKIDVFAVDLIWVPRFVKWAEPLSVVIDSELSDDLLKYALESCYYDTTLVSLPLYLDIAVLYYRKDLLRGLPDFDKIQKKLQSSMSWEEFRDLHGQLAYLNKPFYVFPADNYEGLICSFVELIPGLNYTSGSEERTVLLNTERNRAGLSFLVDLIAKYKMTPPAVLEFRETDSYEYALQHDAIFFRGWPGNLKAYEERYSNKIREIGVAALPHYGSDDRTAVFGGWNLMVSKDSEHKAEAIKFLKFLVSTEMQKIFFETMGYLPVNQNVYDDLAFVRDYPELGYYRKYFEKGFHRPSLKNYTKISDILSFYIKSAMKGDLGVDQALEEATARINSRKVFIN